MKNRPFQICWTLTALLILLAPLQGRAQNLNPYDKADQQKILARVHGDPIRLGDLVNFAKTSASFYPYLQIPGGIDKILKEMISRRLFILEGKQLGIPEPEAEKGDDELYVLRIRKRLLPAPPPITDEQARAFYEAHPEEFSTPLLLRVYQIKVFSGKDEAAAKKKIEAAERELKDGKPFADVARAFSEDAFSKSRGGDMGFIPVNDVNLPEIEKVLTALKPGQISQVVHMKDAYVIYKVTDRREPILDPYDQVADQAKRKAEVFEKKAALDSLLKRLEAKWGVEVYQTPQ